MVSQNQRGAFSRALCTLRSNFLPNDSRSCALFPPSDGRRRGLIRAALWERKRAPLVVDVTATTFGALQHAKAASPYLIFGPFMTLMKKKGRTFQSSFRRHHHRKGEIDEESEVKATFGNFLPLEDPYMRSSSSSFPEPLVSKRVSERVRVCVGERISLDVHYLLPSLLFSHSVSASAIH